MPCPVACRFDVSSSTMADAAASQEPLAKALGCARSEAARASRWWHPGCSARLQFEFEPRIAARRSKAQIRPKAQIRLHATVARCWSWTGSLVRLTRVLPQFHCNAADTRSGHTATNLTHSSYTRSSPRRHHRISAPTALGTMAVSSSQPRTRLRGYTHAFRFLLGLHDRSTGSCSSAARARCAWPSGSPPCRPRRSSRSPRT